MSSNIFKSIVERAECYISICIVGNGLNRLSVLVLQHEVKGISFKSFVLQSLTCLQCQRSLCVVGIGKYDFTLGFFSYNIQFSVFALIYCYSYCTSCIRIVCYTFCASSLLDCVGVGISYICKRILNGSKAQ